jgi:hypothetical protein
MTTLGLHDAGSDNLFGNVRAVFALNVSFQFL